MTYANDNRSPAEHRAILAKQRAGQGDDEPRQVKNWPASTWAIRNGKRHLIGTLTAWQDDNAMPAMDHANDNQGGAARPMDATIRDAVDADDIMAAIKKDEEEPGKHWNPTKMQVYVRGRWRSINDIDNGSVHSSKMVPVDWLAREPDAETEMARMIDAPRRRKQLGDMTCAVLDLAASDGTLREIGELFGKSGRAAERAGGEAIEKCCAEYEKLRAA